MLTAALQVLRAEGAARFTTARVAERAGVSVGSLYQYFPNKAAILFRLQSEEWQQTTALLARLLQDASQTPAVRLRSAVQAFLRSECDEAEVRLALGDAAPLYRDAPEAHAVRAAGSEIFRCFVREMLPRNPAVVARAADLIETTLSRVGSSYSRTPRTQAEITVYADAMADMFCAYLACLAKAADGEDQP